MNNPLFLYNSLTRQKEIFAPQNPTNVRMYVCGMTVYDYCHLGHARVMIVFDMIARWLRALGYPLTYVRNITDIDDKIIARANERGISIQELTQIFIDAMHEDSNKLGILPPDFEPRATEYIPQMIGMIRELIDSGKAYVANNGDIYYAVRTFSAYGQLSGKSIDSLQAGARVEVDEAKRDPLDFVLWKSAKPQEPHWDSPWGIGRPGWHLECSVMSASLLGQTFDIHGGGADLQFPHHENEIAQSCGVMHDGTHCHVHYWIHNGFVRVDDEKMSKSLGNFFTIREVLEQYSSEVIRFFMLRTHYRSPLNYSDAHLQDAKNALTRLYTALNHIQANNNVSIQYDTNEYTKRFFDAMNDDFGSPQAIAILFELAVQTNKTQDPDLAGYLKKLGNLLGLLQQDPTQFLQGDEDSTQLSNQQIEALIQQRNEARAKKDWVTSDKIREQLAKYNIILEDNGQITTWRKN